MAEQFSHEPADAGPSLEEQVSSLWDLVEMLEGRISSLEARTLEARVSSLEAEHANSFHQTTSPSDGYLIDFTSEVANQERHSCEDWAATFATLVNHQDVQAVQSLYQMYLSACGEEVNDVPPVATATSTRDVQSSDPSFKTSRTDSFTDVRKTDSRQPCERVLIVPSCSLQSSDTDRQTQQDDTTSSIKTSRSAKPIRTNGEASQIKTETAASALDTTLVAKEEFTVNTGYPTPDPRASIDIAEVIQPRIQRQDVIGSHIQTLHTPDLDPPEYTEEDYDNYQDSQSSVSEHPWNSSDEGTEDRPESCDVRIGFDVEAFHAAEFILQEFDEEDDEEDDDNEYPGAIESETDSWSEQDLHTFLTWSTVFLRLPRTATP
ncbi:MAG: hypothetical protein Q9221_006235 [Calogaya cf. arnoldii]